MLKILLKICKLCKSTLDNDEFEVPKINISFYVINLSVSTQFGIFNIPTEHLTRLLCSLGYCGKSGKSNRGHVHNPLFGTNFNKIVHYLNYVVSDSLIYIFFSFMFCFRGKKTFSS